MKRCLLKRISALLLALCTAAVLISALSLPAAAATSGKVGACKWTLDGTVLTISGNGNPTDTGDRSPWNAKVTEVIVKEGVTEIAFAMFSNHTALCKVTLPSTLKRIEAAAFSGCSSLESITLPRELEYIGDGAFSECNALKSIDIPYHVLGIGVDAFGDCAGMERITVSENNGYYCSVDGVLYNKDRTALIKYPSAHPGETFTVPDTVREIRSFAFDGAKRLRAIDIPAQLDSVGANAFFNTFLYTDESYRHDGIIYLENVMVATTSDAEQGNELTVRPGTRVIAEHAVLRGEHLRTVYIPEGVVTIGSCAFGWKEELTTVYLPHSLKTIESEAFTQSPNIARVVYRGSERERAALVIKSWNTSLTDAAWEYDTCDGGAEHRWGMSMTTRAVSCTEAGEQRKLCSLCDDFLVETLLPSGHAMSDWTTEGTEPCQEKRSCANCDFFEIRALEHVFGDWTTESESTCTEGGKMTRACLGGCGKTQIRWLPTAAHDYEASRILSRPTLREQGERECVCAVCGATRTDPIPPVSSTTVVGIAVTATVLLLLVGGVLVLVCCENKRRAAPPKTDS